jgi:hypothetical protein
METVFLSVMAVLTHQDPDPVIQIPYVRIGAGIKKGWCRMERRCGHLFWMNILQRALRLHNLVPKADKDTGDNHGRIICSRKRGKKIPVIPTGGSLSAGCPAGRMVSVPKKSNPWVNMTW